MSRRCSRSQRGDDVPVSNDLLPNREHTKVIRVGSKVGKKAQKAAGRLIRMYVPAANALLDFPRGAPYSPGAARRNATPRTAPDRMRTQGITAGQVWREQGSVLLVPNPMLVCGS